MLRAAAGGQQAHAKTCRIQEGIGPRTAAAQARGQKRGPGPPQPRPPFVPMNPRIWFTSFALAALGKTKRKGGERGKTAAVC